MCHSVASEGLKAPEGTKMQIVDLSGSAKHKTDWLKAPRVASARRAARR